MQYEFRAKTLSGAVRKSLAKQAVRYERKSSATIDSGAQDYNRERISIYVEEGRRYTISWDAHERADDGGSYGIDIQSYDGHGSYREGFQSSGYWSFRARVTGEIEFTIGVSRSFGSRWSSYPVDISID